MGGAALDFTLTEEQLRVQETARRGASPEPKWPIWRASWSGKGNPSPKNGRDAMQRWGFSASICPKNMAVRGFRISKRFWCSKNSSRSAAMRTVVEWRPATVTTQRRSLLVATLDEPIELYDLRVDPQQRNNVAADRPQLLGLYARSMKTEGVDANRDFRNISEAAPPRRDPQAQTVFGFPSGLYCRRRRSEPEPPFAADRRRWPSTPPLSRGGCGNTQISSSGSRARHDAALSHGTIFATAASVISLGRKRGR